MKNITLSALVLLFLSVSAQAYSTEYSARKYQEKYFHEKSTSELKLEYTAVTKELDTLVKEGGKACNNASETFNTMEAERVGRKLYDACESYRHGNVRKQIHKDKVIKRAIEFEFESRGIKY
ncbi:MAG: hypothetical protein DRG24_01620 [Epsilonproteobacteria bacterium]|nr:MAG: hypothetical protein DRG24_01620 [Campylobacterota bacterium]